MSATALPYGDGTVAAVARQVFGARDGLQVSELTTEGRSTSTVTRALAALREYGILVDGEPRKSVGRPATPVHAPHDVAVVGISVIGADDEPSGIVGAVTDLAGHPLDPPLTSSAALTKSQRTEPAELAAAIAGLATELTDAVDGVASVVGLGVSIGGYVREGVLRRFPGLVWPPFDMQTVLHEATGLAVRVDNDANAFAAELAVHAEVPQQGIVAVLCVLGDGIGGAWIVDGRVRRGARGSAMEPGHLAVAPDNDLFNDSSANRGIDHKCRCLAVGCVEAYAAPSRMRLALKYANDEAGLDLETAAGKPFDVDDEVAVNVFERAGYALGRGVGNIVNTIDPDSVLLYVPTVFARAKRGSLAEAWRKSLYDAAASSDFAFQDADAETVAALVELIELTAEDSEVGAAVAAAALVSESLLDQVAGVPTPDSSFLSPDVLIARSVSAHVA